MWRAATRQRVVPSRGHKKTWARPVRDRGNDTKLNNKTNVLYVTRGLRGWKGCLSWPSRNSRRRSSRVLDGWRRRLRAACASRACLPADIGGVSLASSFWRATLPAAWPSTQRAIPARVTSRMQPHLPEPKSPAPHPPAPAPPPPCPRQRSTRLRLSSHRLHGRRGPLRAGAPPGCNY